MQNFTKCAANDVVIRLLDEHDPDDRKTIERAAVADYWKDMNDLARARYADAEAGRRRELAVNHVRALLLERAERAARSYGSGLVPLVQWFRPRGSGSLELI